MEADFKDGYVEIEVTRFLSDKDLKISADEIKAKEGKDLTVKQKQKNAAAKAQNLRRRKRKMKMKNNKISYVQFMQYLQVFDARIPIGKSQAKDSIDRYEEELKSVQGEDLKKDHSHNQQRWTV